MNNIFLFDIDGTLSKDRIIPASAKEALKMIRAKGDYCLLATGRCLGQMTDILTQIDVDGAIMQNGGYSVIKGKTISKYPIPKEAILSLIKDGYKVALLTKSNYARIEDDKIFKEFADYFKIPMAEYKSLDILNEEIYSLGVYTYNPEKLDKSKYKDLDFVLVAPLGFDVIKKGINKSSPIKDLRIMYPNAKIISFGDNYNDLEMLKASDVAIVMPTAPEKVKECATFVTKDVFEDGILYAVKEYLKYEN